MAGEAGKGQANMEYITKNILARLVIKHTNSHNKHQSGNGRGRRRCSLGGNLNSHLDGLGQTVLHVLVNWLNALHINVGDHLKP